MGEQTLITVSCTLPAETIPLIEEKAKAVEMSRSEYLRTLILSGLSKPVDEAVTPISRDPIILLQQILYGLLRTHIAIYRMPRLLGTISDEQLEAISKDTARMGIEYLATLDDRLALTRQELADQLATPHPNTVAK